MPRGKRADTGNTELDLVPIMNMVTILIPFLLLSVQFVTLAVIDSTLPAMGPPDESKEEKKDEEEKLDLTVAITGTGYTVLGRGGKILGDEEGKAAIPCKIEDCPSVDAYDVASLTEDLTKIKEEFPEEQNVILLPENSVPYEVLIATMDATRSNPNKKDSAGKSLDLFPFVVIAGGGN